MGLRGAAARVPARALRQRLVHRARGGLAAARALGGGPEADRRRAPQGRHRRDARAGRGRRPDPRGARRLVAREACGLARSERNCAGGRARSPAAPCLVGFRCSGRSGCLVCSRASPAAEDASTVRPPRKRPLTLRPSAARGIQRLRTHHHRKGGGVTPVTTQPNQPARTPTGLRARDATPSRAQRQPQQAPKHGAGGKPRSPGCAVPSRASESAAFASYGDAEDSAGMTRALRPLTMSMKTLDRSTPRSSV